MEEIKRTEDIKEIVFHKNTNAQKKDKHSKKKIKRSSNCHDLISTLKHQALGRLQDIILRNLERKKIGRRFEGGGGGNIGHDPEYMRTSQLE